VLSSPHAVLGLVFAEPVGPLRVQLLAINPLICERAGVRTQLVLLVAMMWTVSTRRSLRVRSPQNVHVIANGTVIADVVVECLSTSSFALSIATAHFVTRSPYHLRVVSDNTQVVVARTVREVPVLQIPRLYPEKPFIMIHRRSQNRWISLVTMVFWRP